MLHPPQLFKGSQIETEPLSLSAPAPSRHFDFASAWELIINRKRLIATTTILAVIASILYILFSPPQYTAITQMSIDPTDLRIVENGLTPNASIPEVAVMQVESQLRVLMSDNVLRRVVADEGLDIDREFGANRSILAGLIDSIFTLFGSSRARFDPILVALNELQRRVRVRRAERTYVVDVSVTTEDRDKSVRIANSIAQAYLAEQSAARAEAARRTSESLAARLEELKDRVRQAEERVEQFKARNNIVGASGLLVNEQQLSDLNNQLSLARGRTAEAKSRFDQIQALKRSGADIGAFSEAVQSHTITNLRTQYAEILRREAEQTISLGPRHPTVIEVHAQAQRVRLVISEEIARIAEAARNDYERALANEDSLARTLEALKRTAIATNEAMVQLRELERDVQVSRAVYQSFLSRSRETGEQERLDTKNVRIISKADLPLRRSWPPPYSLLLLGGMIFGISSGVGLALLRAYIDDRSGTARLDRAPSSELPVLAVLPDLSHTGAEQALKNLQDPKSAPGTEIRRLYDLLRGDRRNWVGQSILVAALQDRIEIATIGINLALLAAANHSVLLIDADIHQQALTALLSDKSQAGLVDVASGQKRLSEIIIHDPRTNINVLPLVGRSAGKYGQLEDDDIKSAFHQTNTNPTSE
jgi:uncharacterized protein involved in exopolysaccharide biosynthesis